MKKVTLAALAAVMFIPALASAQAASHCTEVHCPDGRTTSCPNDNPTQAELVSACNMAAPQPAAAAQCDAECQLIRKITTDEPNMFRNLHDCDGVMTLTPPTGGMCEYQYKPFAGRAELFCTTTDRVPLSAAKERYEADVAALASILGPGWQVAPEEKNPITRKVTATNPATGATLDIEVADIGDHSFASIRERSRVRK